MECVLDYQEAGLAVAETPHLALAFIKIASYYDAAPFVEVQALSLAEKVLKLYPEAATEELKEALNILAFQKSRGTAVCSRAMALCAISFPVRKKPEKHKRRFHKQKTYSL